VSHDQELLGTAEVAKLLGVERPRIGKWAAQGKMPKPVAVLAMGPVYSRDDIEAMREGVEARRKPRKPKR
jgi:predicted DNA-binding transcriptional regulator AlpA